jgi:hypothetical protein
MRKQCGPKFKAKVVDLSPILRHGFRLRKSMKEKLSHGGDASKVHA